MTHCPLPQELLELVVDKVAEDAAADGDQSTLRACHQSSISLCLRSRVHLFKYVSVPRRKGDPFISIQKFLDIATPLPLPTREGYPDGLPDSCRGKLPWGIAPYIYGAWVQFSFGEEDDKTTNRQSGSSTDGTQKKGMAESVVALLDVLHGAEYGVRDLAFWNWPTPSSGLPVRPDTQVRIHEATRRLFRSPFLRTLRLHAIASFPVELLIGTSIREVYHSMLAGGLLEDVAKFRNHDLGSGVNGVPDFPVLELLDCGSVAYGASAGLHNGDPDLSDYGGLRRLMGSLKVLRCGAQQGRDPATGEDILVPAALLSRVCHRTLESVTLPITPNGPGPGRLPGAGRWPSMRAFDNFFKLPFQNLDSIALRMDESIDGGRVLFAQSLDNEPTLTVCCSVIRSLNQHLDRKPRMVTIYAKSVRPPPLQEANALGSFEGRRRAMDSDNLLSVGEAVKQIDWRAFDTLTQGGPSGLSFSLLLCLTCLPAGRLQFGYPTTCRLMDLDEVVKEDIMAAAPSLKFTCSNALRVEVSGMYYRSSKIRTSRTK